MQIRLAPQEVFTGFTLTSLRDYSYESLLASLISEEVILAILSDFNRQKPSEVVRLVLIRLQGIVADEMMLRKYIRQL